MGSFCASCVNDRKSRAEPGRFDSALYRFASVDFLFIPPPPPSPSPPPPQLSPEERAARARAEALKKNGASASGIPGFLDAAMRDKVKEKVVQAVSDELDSQ